MLNIYQQNRPQDETGKKDASAAPQSAKQADFRKYVDPTGELRSKEFERGIWVVSHRVWIYRLIVLVLALLCFFLWMTSLIRWGIFFADWQKQTNVLNQLARFPNYNAINQRLAPEEVQVLDTALLAGGADRYDAVAEMANPNKQFIVSFDYRFLVNGSSTDKASATLLPGEARPIAILGLKDYDLGDVTLRVDAVRWKRLNRRAYPNPVEYQKERLDFTVSNFVFTPAQAGDGVPANALTFEVTNNSTFHFIEPRFLVGLYNADTLVGVMPLTLDVLNARQTKKVDLRNFVRDVQVSSITLFPLINVYDKEAYRTP